MLYGGGAIIHAGFDPKDRTDIVKPGCTLVAIWPIEYDDVFYGADNCLYDAGGRFMHISELTGQSLPKRFLTILCLLQAIAFKTCAVLRQGHTIPK